MSNLQELVATARERFASDTAEHKMELRLDVDTHRHLRFLEPGTGMYWFDVITWPGNLVLDGDMGTYHFAREHDMFGFFGGADSINPDYWAEKLRGGNDGRSLVKSYSPDRARQVILEHCEHLGWTDRLNNPVDVPALITLEFECDELYLGDEHTLRQQLANFRFGRNQFYDTWEWDFTEYSPRYVWSCWAIQWAIQQYRGYKDSGG